jgi:hypothetical protein
MQLYCICNPGYLDIFPQLGSALPYADQPAVYGKKGRIPFVGYLSILEVRLDFCVIIAYFKDAITYYAPEFRAVFRIFRIAVGTDYFIVVRKINIMLFYVAI